MKSNEQKLVEMPGSELNSLLLGVFKARAEEVTPAKALAEWRQNPLFRLSRVSARVIRELEDVCLSSAPDFELIDLPPYSPFGTVCSVAPVSQNHIFTSLRGVEIVADSTNVLALEAAARRRSGTGEVHLSAIHRLARAQKFPDPAMLAHFKVFSLVTAGRDEGSWKFERNLLAHILTYLEVLRAWVPQHQPTVTLFSQGQAEIPGAAEELRLRGAQVEWQEKRKSGNGYYPVYSFFLGLKIPGGVAAIADGGFVGWTRKLLQNRKERLMISGIGIDRLAALRAVSPGLRP